MPSIKVQKQSPQYANMQCEAENNHDCNSQILFTTLTFKSSIGSVVVEFNACNQGIVEEAKNESKKLDSPYGGTKYYFFPQDTFNELKNKLTQSTNEIVTVSYYP